MAKSPNNKSEGTPLESVTAETFANAPLMMTADELAETLCISK